MSIFSRLKEMKKNRKSGFTLVELIVVLVILTILAAILVPALLGYIDKAREKQYALEARSIYEATQAYVTEQYGKGNYDRDTLPTELSDGMELENGETLNALTEISDIADVEVSSIDSITYNSSDSINGLTVIFTSANDGKLITGVMINSSWGFSEVKQ